MEEKVARKTIYDGKIIQVYEDQARIEDGRIVERVVVNHPGGVGIALEDEEGKFFLVRQYRYAQQKEMLEFPAGKKEFGEDPLTCAKREIQEEVGYCGKDFQYLGKLVPTGAYDSEVIDCYYAKKGEYVGTNFDEDEDIKIESYTLEEIEEMILDGTIDDAKTITMTYFIKNKCRLRK